MAQDMTLLWGSGSPPCWRVMIALEEKNLQGYNQKLLSFEKMEHKSQEVLDINPRGQESLCSAGCFSGEFHQTRLCDVECAARFSSVQRLVGTPGNLFWFSKVRSHGGSPEKLPSFKHGDTVVNESYAACFYLESQFQSQGNKLIPDSPAEQTLMYQRMFEGLTFYEKLNGVTHYELFVPEGERHDSALKRNAEDLKTELKLWEGYLQKLGSNSYLAGPSFSLADVTVFPTVATLFRFGLSAQNYPKLGEYYALLKERPSVKASWPPDWLENPEEEDRLKDI